MASYGVFLAACGYEYHGPKGHLAFAPRLTPEDFRAAFTAAEGWGRFPPDAFRGRHADGRDGGAVGQAAPCGASPGARRKREAQSSPT